MRTGQDTREPLAIVGIGCRFPGGADSAASYWDLLCSGTDATRTVPETRWNAAKYRDPNPAKAGKMVTDRGGFLSEIDQFDPQFFGISPREANLLDPQQRLLLSATWEALEDGGIPAETVAGADVGVFIGGFTLDYQLLQNQGRTSRFRFKTHSATGMMMTMLANRISFAFDFRGPSMAIDTACSSSLVAVHLAALSIWNGECDLALAGGVNVIIGPNTAIAESKSGFLSPDGRCKAFDESADGYGRGEGGAVVIIKPLAQALSDGDKIYAQILGSAVSQDGRTDGITVPSEDAQRTAITTALQRAGVHPNEIGYVEAHGTGTPVGDPVEMRALSAALTADRTAANPLLIGSAKTNIGHLEAGAGVAGLIKAALVVEHGYIPANLHLQNPSAQIPFRDLNIDVPRTGRPFPAGPRRIAGVNSFGFGGTNAHLVLAEPPASLLPPTHSERQTEALLPISARSEEALVATAHRLAEHLDANPGLSLTDLGYTLSQRRSHLSYRRTLTASSISEAREVLQALADDGQVPAGRTSATPPKLAFVCTGMGPQWWRMCRGLLDVYPEFTESIRRSDRELSRYTDWSLIDELRADEASSRMGDTDVAQPANFAIQVALAEQLRAFGISPDAVIGHSAGEVAAHHLAGILTFEQAVRLIYHRSRLQHRTTGLGRMLAVGLNAELLAQTLDERSLEVLGRQVSIAAINSPSAVTLAGDSGVLEDISRQLDEAEIFNRFLPVQVPYHTHFMDAVKDDLHSSLEGLTAGAAAIPLYSTVTGDRLDGPSAGSAYWWQNTRATVLFESALRRMLDDGYTHFVELGPHPVLAASIIEIAGTHQSQTVVLATQRRDEDESRTLMNCVGALHCNGQKIAWDALYPPGEARLLTLPSYPWQSKRYWNETPEVAEDLHYHPVHPLLGQPVSAVHPTWEAELNTTVIPFLADHQVQGSVVLPGAVYIEVALAAATEAYGSADYSVDNLMLLRAVILDDSCDPILRTTLNRGTGVLEFAVFTASAGGDVKWTIAATAELNTLPRSPERCDIPCGTAPVNSVDGDEFYARTRAMGFAYGEAFQTVSGIASGDDWAIAQITAPAQITHELDSYRFHPALADAALQTLLGAPLPGRGTSESPYLPVQIRRSSIYRSPEKDMTAHVRVVSATRDEIESDITITSDDGELLAVFNGFTVQSLEASSGLSPERLDKGLYEIHWVSAETPLDRPDPVGTSSWLILVDAAGLGAALAEELRGQGHQVRTLELPRQSQQLDQLLATELAADGDLAGVINCWPLDICGNSDENDYQTGVFPILGLVKALAEHRTVAPRLYLLTANAQPVPGTDALNVEQAAIWGLARVIGHQEFAHQWGGVIDIDDTDERSETAARVCAHILSGDVEDQVAIRDQLTFVPRLRPCANLTEPFPTKLTADATYVVTGGTGALGRTVAHYLAERGARHIALLSRTGHPPDGDTIRTIERLGTRVSTASVDITDPDQVGKWLDDHLREGGRPVRGIVHAAGSVADQLLVNMSEADFAKVLAPKVAGTRVLHNALAGQDLDFFVMFGSAGSVIASPGQGNYAAANAFLDAFAHYRQGLGLPALTIGWGPWSVGMVEELELENLYAQRGIELITPAVGTRILDRLINQKTPNAIAISADWGRARSAGLSTQLPPMFSELGTAEAAPEHDSQSSILDLLAACPPGGRLDVVTDHVRQIVGAVFGMSPNDIGPDDALDDLGLDSMMAMDFRTRVNAYFAIDVPVLELLRGVSVNSLAGRVLSDLEFAGVDVPAGDKSPVPGTDDDVERLIDQLSEADLRALLAELEGQPDESESQ